jgi:SRR1 protein
MHAIECICEDNKLTTITCYGIGKISESTVSRHQLAFLQILAKQLDIQVINIWDPLITEEEWEYYDSLGYNKVHFPIKAEKVTLFYMPHCDFHVYDQLLSFQGHASLLHNTIIFGNTFDGYALRDPTKVKSAFISRLKYDTEHVDAALYDRHDVFNDCSLMHNFRLKP